MVLVGTIMDEGRERTITIGSYSRIPNSNLVEVALVVKDDWQNKGLGIILFKYLAEITMKHGIARFTVWVLTSNSKMIHIFKKSSYHVKYKIEGDLHQIETVFGKQSKLKD